MNKSNKFLNKIKGFFVKVDDKEPGIVTLYNKNAFQSILSSIISIAIGLLVGLIIMIIISFTTPDITIGDAFSGLFILLKGSFASTNTRYLLSNTGNVIFYSVPLILTGLSVGIAYKTGLFNIGAPGQYIMGTVGALMVGLSIQTTNRFSGIMVWILAILAGMICGAIWGIIPGILKAFFNINEVIVCIMTNWIAANFATWFFMNQTSIISTENTKSAYLITTKLTGNYTPVFGFDKVFPGSLADFGIILAIIIAVVIHIIMNKTVLGFELKACGSNRNASKYAGLNEKRNIMLSMVIAGALAGLAASLYFLNPGIEYKYQAQYSNLPAYGFNGIASAFLANCNPIGTIFSSLFIRYLNMGGEYLTKVGYNRYIADIIIAIIIYIAGFTRIIREFLSKRKRKNLKKLGEEKETKVVIEEPDSKPTNQEPITEANTDNIVKEAQISLSFAFPSLLRKPPGIFPAA